MLNIPAGALRTYPYPHLVVDGIFDDCFFDELEAAYPSIARSDTWNRMSADLMIGDAQYTALVASGPWKRLHDYLTSSVFVRTLLDLFEPHIADRDLKIKLADVHLGSHVETREWIAASRVASEVAAYQGDLSEVFVRVDLGTGEVGYQRPSHLDWRHRICSILIYFDNAQDLSLEGGVLNIEAEVPGGVRITQSIPPRRNRAVIKLDNNHSFHSVDEITRATGSRRTLYVAVSSRGAVW